MCVCVCVCQTQSVIGTKTFLQAFLLDFESFIVLIFLDKTTLYARISCILHTDQNVSNPRHKNNGSCMKCGYIFISTVKCVLDEKHVRSYFPLRIASLFDRYLWLLLYYCGKQIGDNWNDTPFSICPWSRLLIDNIENMRYGHRHFWFPDRLPLLENVLENVNAQSIHRMFRYFFEYAKKKKNIKIGGCCWF